MVRPRDPAPQLGPRRERRRAVHLQQPHAKATVHEQVQAQELEASKPPPVVASSLGTRRHPLGTPIAPSRQRTQRRGRAPPHPFPHALVAPSPERCVELGRQRLERPVALEVRVGVPRVRRVRRVSGAFVYSRRRRRVVGEVHRKRRNIRRVPRSRREPDQPVAVHVPPRARAVVVPRVPPREQDVRAQVNLAAEERERISNVALRDPRIRPPVDSPVGPPRPLQRLAGGASDDGIASLAADGSLDDPPGAALDPVRVVVVVVVVEGFVVEGGERVRLRGQHEGSRRDGVSLGVSPQHHRERVLVRDGGGPREVVDERVGG
mmetsp:Transcript_4138/g.16965  ORF Transcript_4138/g.16965 Transcript_4138/m.16965 type:complete len:321 (+) Transcript_4138:1395-2357(+)